MADDDVLVISTAAFIVIAGLSKRKKKKRWWTTKIYRNRLVTRGKLFLNDLMQEDGAQFRNFTRMSSDDFFYLLESIRDKITRSDTHFRKAITAEERLAITLRYLATGDSFSSLQYLFNVSKQVISKFVPEVCKEIINTLSQHVKVPSTTDEWLKIAEKFNETWNFPHCLGALDGKHIPLQCPINSGSIYYNYKSNFSIVLMALVDGDYNFIFVDVGCQGGVSDGGVFKNCQLYKDMEKNILKFLRCSPLPGRNKEMPYVFVADEAFALTENIMKPYSGRHRKGSKERIFNYRLSRARRIVENAFGIISAVFRVLRKPMLLEPETAKVVVMATICLHNFLRKSHSSRNIYTPDGTFDKEKNEKIIPGSWREGNGDKPSLAPLENVPRKSSISAQNIPAEFTDYFCSHGSVPWQNDYA
ncbi:unnamed protein product [Acanthoscelides obtectus]|uniref:DDE Tnp4 domain-containing protein n=1 Tax=Acanthoscelides obtectus TaxID=200917 RepID=A0A9P0L1E0_ACAOB|nr:unnamed protein product [Acanthoscelides obtectus]CAK1680845.1 Protein ALP1-like [Acanthoscelides obtectus]